VIAEFGPSSETNGILGRIYKDRWDLAHNENRPEAKSLLRRAIDTYLDGFEADWRNAYPGVNAVFLMEMLDRRDPRQAQVLPVVRYSAMRKKEKAADYWDYATLLELAVLANDRDDAEDQLHEAITNSRHNWELESTARNLGLVRKARLDRGEDAGWIEGLEAELGKAAKALAVPKPAG
jgi:hypothetical protein